jgi:hypothetical protein
MDSFLALQINKNPAHLGKFKEVVVSSSRLAKPYSKGIKKA